MASNPLKLSKKHSHSNLDILDQITSVPSGSVTDYGALLNRPKVNGVLLNSGENTVPVGDINVQSDWNETDPTSDAYIKNKPSGSLGQIQSDWNQTDTSAKDYIKNKPEIPVVTGKADKVANATTGNFAGLDSNGNLTDSQYAPGSFATAAQGTKADSALQSGSNISLLNNDKQYVDVNYHDSFKQDTISDLDTIRTGAASGSTAYQKPGTGIPKADLNSAVTASLDKADSAIQGVQIGRTDITPDADRKVNLPNADATHTGLLTHQDQVIGGNKHFSGSIESDGGVSAKGIVDLTISGGGGSSVEVIADANLDTSEGAEENLTQVASAFAVARIKGLLNESDIPIFTNNTLYKRGELCRYLFGTTYRIYRFNERHSGSWDLSKVSHVDISELSKPLCIPSDIINNLT